MLINEKKFNLEVKLFCFSYDNRVADYPLILNCVVETKIADKVQNLSAIAGSRRLFWTLIGVEGFQVIITRSEAAHTEALQLALRADTDLQWAFLTNLLCISLPHFCTYFNYTLNAHTTCTALLRSDSLVSLRIKYLA